MNCVDIISKAATDSGLKFQMGHLDEICGILASEGKANMERYPAVLLLEDLRETYDYGMLTAHPQLIVVATSKPTERPKGRWEDSFEGVIRPVTRKFLHRIERYAAAADKTSMEFYNRPKCQDAFNASQKGRQVFNDYLNGVEIKNLKISYLESEC